MIIRKSTENIIFNLNSIIHFNKFKNSYQLNNNFERLIFSIFELNISEIDLYLISDFNKEELDSTVKMLGLDFYFKYINNSSSIGYSLENIKFWQKYIAKLNIEIGKSMLVDNNKIIANSAIKQGLAHAILIKGDNAQVNIEQNNIKYINSLSDLILNTFTIKESLLES